MKKSIVISLLAVAIICCTALCSFASTGIVTTDTLRLRKGASTEASIVALLSINDKVEILGEENGWYKVNATAEGTKYTGYVSKDYIKVEENTNTNENKAIEEENNTEEENKINDNSQEENNNQEQPEDQGESSENKIYVKAIASGVKVYLTPVINSMVLNTLEEEKTINVISEVKGWTYIEAVDVKGWVKTENITEREALESEQSTSSQKTGYISGSSVNFREEAKTSGKVISKLKRNTQVTVISEENGWSQIEYAGKTGYVSSDYISDKKQETTSRSSVNRKTSSAQNTKSTKSTETKTKDTVITSSKGKASGSEIVAYAKKYLGYKYVYGGATPSGFDCSGFTSYVYKHFGYSLSRSSSAQSSNR